MKTLKDLTPEIRAKIEDYKKEVRRFYDGIPFDRDASVKYIEKIYSIANRKKPIVIFAENPIQYKLYFSLLKKNVDIINKAFLIKNKCCSVDTNSIFVNKEVHFDLDNRLRAELRAALGAELDDELCDDLYSELDAELDAELCDELGAELSNKLGKELDINFVNKEINNELDSALSVKLHVALDSALRAELRAALSVELRAALGAELDAELYDELYSELDAELDAELYDELYSELDAELDAALSVELRAALGAELDSALHDELSVELYIELRAALGAELSVELRAELDSALGAELDAELDSEIKSHPKSHYLHFCSPYTRAYLCWYMFVMNEFDIPFSKKEMLEDLYYLFNKTSISRCYFTESYCLVLKNPSKIHFQDSLLHNIKGPAIDYNGKGDIYCIRGVRVEKEIFHKILSKNINFSDILKIKNEEEKSAFLYMIEELYGSEYFISIIKDLLKEMDTYVDKKNSLYLEGTTKGMNVGVYTLFKGRLDNIELSYVRCYCPSTDRMFFLGVDPVYDNAKDAIASLYRVPRKLQNEIVYLQRQGERYSTVFTKECMDRIEKGFYSKEDFEDTVSITGDEYFNKIRYEY